MAVTSDVVAPFELWYLYAEDEIVMETRNHPVCTS
jgi:hypothetical protein